MSETVCKCGHKASHHDFRGCYDNVPDNKLGWVGCPCVVSDRDLLEANPVADELATLTARIAAVEAERDAANAKLARVWDLLNKEPFTEAQVEEAYNILKTV
jgi:hypothetical protein